MIESALNLIDLRYYFQNLLKVLFFVYVNLILVN
jgi:hypothetical protein